MKTACLLFLTMSWLTLTTGSAAPLRAQPALECGSGAAAFDWGASSAARKAVVALPHSKAPAFGPRALAWGEGVLRLALSPAAAPRRPVQSDAGRAFTRRRVMDAQGTQPATARRRLRGHLGAASQKVNRPKQPPNRRQGSAPGSAMNLHQPGLDKSGGAAIGGLISGKTVNNRALVRTPSVVRPAVPLLSNVRHRDPNPAVMGGSLNSHGTNTGTIDGTRMNHRM
jgi:hypothetical protein